MSEVTTLGPGTLTRLGPAIIVATGAISGALWINSSMAGIEKVQASASASAAVERAEIQNKLGMIEYRLGAIERGTGHPWLRSEMRAWVDDFIERNAKREPGSTIGVARIP